jgi:hypothetical protein
MSLKFVFSKDGISGSAHRPLSDQEMTSVQEAFGDWMGAAEHNHMLNPLGETTCAHLLGQALMTAGPKGSPLRRSFMSILAVVDTLAEKLAKEDGGSTSKDN